MKLLSTAASGIPRMEEFIGSLIPRYAILSHTWDRDEVSFQELTSAAAAAAPAAAGIPTTGSVILQQTKPGGLRKIQQAYRLARERDGLDWAWVDTCCIDKTSSAELSEAIDSMYAWYRDAAVCYAYLSDLEPLPPGKSPADWQEAKKILERELPKCRWFTRGWTLQELIAPKEVLFFDREWNFRGSKVELADLIEQITWVSALLLRGTKMPDSYAVARRMSWAARRNTTRVEDMAYCLLGIFDVNMTLIYGEGIKAFGRLQAAILQTTPDSSIFAWIDDRQPCRQYAGILAESPRQFACHGDIELYYQDPMYADFAITTRGIVAQASVLRKCLDRRSRSRIVVLDVFCYTRNGYLAVCVRKVEGGLYARYWPYRILTLEEVVLCSEGAGVDMSGDVVRNLTLATKIPDLIIGDAPGPIPGRRVSALRIDWEPLCGGERPFRVRKFLPLPESHWDEYDGCIVSPDYLMWCSFFIEADQGSATVNFLLGFFFLPSGASVVLASLDDLGATSANLLELRLSCLRVEEYQRAAVLTREILGGRLQESLTTHASPTPYARSVWNVRRSAHPSAGLLQRLTVNLRHRLDPGICRVPVTELQLEAASTVDEGLLIG